MQCRGARMELLRQRPQARDLEKVPFRRIALEVVDTLSIGDLTDSSKMLIPLLIYLYQYYIGMGDTPDVPGKCIIEKNNWLQPTSDSVDGKPVSERFLPQNDGSLCCTIQPTYQASYTCLAGDANGTTYKGVSSKDQSSVDFDCTKENAICRSGKLVLRNGGLLVFYIGQGIGWYKRFTPGEPTKEYSAAKSKYGTNTLLTGQFLRVGEFIGSPSGDSYLTVVKEHAVSPSGFGYKIRMIVARRESACKKQWKGTGSELSYVSHSDDAAGVYKMKLGPIGTEHGGRVAYINNNNEREFYPTDQLQVAGSDEYHYAGEYRQPNVKTIKRATFISSSDQCKTACNKMDECYGFIHDGKKGTCDLKGQDMFPETLDRAFVGGMADAHMFIRLKNVKNSNTCSDRIIGTDAVNFNDLPAGRTITDVDQCTLALSTEAEAKKLKEAGNPLTSALTSFAGSLSDLSGTSGSLQAMDDEQVEKRKADEKEYSAAIKMDGKARALQETVNGMETSAGYDMISSNYQFMVWTTVAVTCSDRGNTY